MISVLRLAALLATFREPPICFQPRRARQGLHHPLQRVIRGRLRTHFVLFVLRHLRGHFQEMEMIVNAGQVVLPLRETVRMSAPHPEEFPLPGVGSWPICQDAISLNVGGHVFITFVP